jgi:spore maturation protein CgeB
MTRTPKLLLISPSFHGYHDSIGRAFSDVGYDVAIHRYDAFDGVRAKLRNKLVHELPGRVGLDSSASAERWATDRTLRVLRDVRPDRLVVIKGDILGASFWSEVESLAVPRILWLYDDLSRHRFSMDFLRGIGSVVSYSREETALLHSQGVNASFLPNAFDPHLVEPGLKRRDEVVFVGSKYPNRVDLLSGLVKAGIPVRAYGRQWSHHPFDRLRTWELSRPDIPAERDVPLSEAYRIQAAAAAAINIHGLQSGLAMRTFEVPGMGGLQLVDRPDVAEFYDVGTETLVFSSLEELQEQSEKALADRGWAEGIREAGRRRSLAEHTFAHRIAVLEELWA